MLWFTSDLHLGDEQIMRFAARPWRNVAEMADALIDNINACVRPADDLYLLGDIAYHLTPEKAAAYLRRLSCEHIHLLFGNHDREWASGADLASQDDYLEIHYRGRKLCLMHYPLLSWNGMYRGSFQLHGHIHSKGPSYNLSDRERGYFRYDVGVDANEYRPVSFADLLAFYKDARPVAPRRDTNEADGQQ